MRIPLIALGFMAATSAQADVTAQFNEGAPKDRFTLTNTGDCALPAGTLTVDLGTAPAGLIFDVTASGAGVEVFQPFEMVAGGETLRNAPRVGDGDTAVTLDLTGLGAGASVAFTIDVDDTGGGREITVTGSEISGAELRVAMGAATGRAAFGADATARLALSGCTS